MERKHKVLENFGNENKFMKNTKKVLSIVLSGALAFGSMGAAFAAVPVMDANTDKKVTESVKRLAELGIVSGMEDGKYHEEMKVTREQFAKILVEALGLRSSADATKGATKFKDIESSRWSSGYVNVAVAQGLLKGYPDGTFNPAAEVSYAEAVTMLVRALGYKDEFLSGNWPQNYVDKAAADGISTGTKFSDVFSKTDRGTVALLVNNTLDVEVVKAKEGELVKYEKVKGLTLLQDKLGIKKVEDVKSTDNKVIENELKDSKVTEVTKTPEYTVNILNSTLPGEKQVYVTMGAGVDGSLWRAFVKKDSSTVELKYNADKNRFQGSTLEVDATAENVTFQKK